MDINQFLNVLGPIKVFLQDYEQTLLTWPGLFTMIGLRLLPLLAAIEMTWTVIQYVLDPNASDLTGFIKLIVRKVLHFSFAFGLMLLAPNVLRLIISGFSTAAFNTSVTWIGLPPAAPLTTTINIIFALANLMQPSGLLFVTSTQIIAGLLFLVIGVAGFVMACMILFNVVESWFLLAIAPFFIAFAGSRWTHALADGFMTAFLRCAVRLFCLILFMQLAFTYMAKIEQAIATWNTIDLRQLAALAGGTACVALVTAFSAGRLAHQLVPGHINFGFNPKIGDY